MPFTFSHPAIVLPLKKLSPQYFYLPAAIIGSMAPDFEYFLRLWPIDQIGHSIMGAFVFDLPLTVIVWILWEYVIKSILIPFLPTPLARKYNTYGVSQDNVFSIHFVTVFLSSTLLGIFSHIFWDQFTHASSDFLVTLPWLMNIVYIKTRPIRVYHLLQQISTVVGLVTVVAVAWWHKDVIGKDVTKKTVKEKFIYWLTYILVALVFFAVFLRIRLAMDIRFELASLVVVLISAGFAGLLVHSIFYHLARMFKKRA